MSEKPGILIMEVNLALYGLLGALVGAIPGVLGVLFNWIRNRDAVSRSLRRIELAKSEVEFISSWLAVAAAVDDEDALADRRQAARARLDRLMSVTEEEIEQSAMRSKEIEVAPRKLRSGIWLYIYTGFVLFLMFGASIDEQNNPSFSQLIQEVSSGDGALTMSIFGVVWIILVARHLYIRRRRV